MVVEVTHVTQLLDLVNEDFKAAIKNVLKYFLYKKDVHNEWIMGFLSREIKTKKETIEILELKSTYLKLKNSLDEINMWLETIGEKSHELGERAIEIISFKE